MGRDYLECSRREGLARAKREHNALKVDDRTLLARSINALYAIAPITGRLKKNLRSTCAIFLSPTSFVPALTRLMGRFLLSSRHR